ncbi:hypothetical protein CLOM_g792 [Closterium sp. NIES-68]|nr:hypothetical protein CLOM_g792 [Closterium sp. NIES-68]GJP64119.1 hypothetical protein CLOP_g21141 [Closterium sp. NIES-67]
MTPESWPPRSRQPPSLFRRHRRPLSHLVLPLVVGLLLQLEVLSSVSLGSGHSCDSGSHKPPSRISHGPSRVSHWSHGSHVSQESHASRNVASSPTQRRRTSLLEAAPSRPPARPILDPSQLRALLDLNAAWHLWPTNSNRARRCDQWDHVLCTQQGFILSIDVSGVGITKGRMPPTLFSRMPYLRDLVVAENFELHGSITHLALPPSMRMLDISFTPLSGSLPSSILSLTALVHLDISYSSLSGDLPPALSSLIHLTYLNIGAQNITGRVEDLLWISSLTNLHTLSLAGMYNVVGDFSALTFLTALKAMQRLSITHLFWTGELPVLLGTLTTLTYLDLSSLQTAQFPRWAMDLTALRHLDAGHWNDLRSGVVPQDLSRLNRLEHFDASGNGLVGTLPEYWTSLEHLTFLSLSHNSVQGSIPSTFSALTTLSTLMLDWNSMDGTIPRVFPTSLNSLVLTANHFSGFIPPFLGTLSGLTNLDLSTNSFTGAVPNSLTNLVNLMFLNISTNQLSSGLDVIGKMPWLIRLDASYNNFTDGYSSFSSLALLNSVFLQGNNFQGPFPTVLLKLTNLYEIDLSQNNFHGTIPSDITKMANLLTLTLGHNNFHGVIPSSLLSLPLDQLYLEHNHLTGSLPSFTSTNLDILNLQGNELSGSLPDFSHWKAPLKNLLLGDNNFTGTIVESVSALTSLGAFSLRGNQLSGSIPTALLTLTNLESMDLASNNISGLLPSGLGALFNLHTLSVYDNQLTGMLPASICDLTNLQTMFLHNNYFYGRFPACLYESCLHRIDISNNSFYGPININFRSMIPNNNALLNIAGNYFYGDPMLYADGCQFCPSNITQSHVLGISELNYPGGSRCGLRFMQGFITEITSITNKRGEASLRQNCFTLKRELECTTNETQRTNDACLAFCSMSRELGPCDGHGACVPPQAGAAGAGFRCECDHGYVTANGSLGSTCARPSPSPPAALSTGAVVGIAVGSAAAFALLLALVVALLWPKQRRRWSGLDVCQEFSIGEILRATDNWASGNVVGKGGFATVYKGVSSKGELWAVKRSKLMSNDFETEVRAMASLRHENVVRLLGFCLHQNMESSQQEQILVYEFVGNGDLKYHIHDSKAPLSLQQRVQLAVGAAEGVAYLHSFATPIVHRDLKPGNILVGEHNQAKIADFGLLKLLSHADGGHDRTRVAGTPGYLDPDYNRTQIVSEKSDVYSFGVVLLELLTKQKPAVEGTDSHISDWAAKKVQGYELGALKDASLEAPDEAVVELADIALDCLKMPASRRPHMKGVARRLHRLLQLHCAAHGNSSMEESSLHMEGRAMGGEGNSSDMFGKSEWSEGHSGALLASRSLVHSLSEKWRMIQ